MKRLLDSIETPRDLRKLDRKQLPQVAQEIRDVRLRPLRDYYAVWSVIEAPETFAIQRGALIDRR